ncbi:hypothetical protein SRIMM317S_01091 [Streptomyces rimosus subsp. rimosus]
MLLSRSHGAPGRADQWTGSPPEAVSVTAVPKPLGRAVTVSRPGPVRERSGSPGRSGIPSAPTTCTETAGRPLAAECAAPGARALPAFSYGSPSSAPEPSASPAVTDGPSDSPVIGAPR